MSELDCFYGAHEWAGYESESEASVSVETSGIQSCQIHRKFSKERWRQCSGAKPRREALWAADNERRNMESPKPTVMMTSQAPDGRHQAKGLCLHCWVSVLLRFHLDLACSHCSPWEVFSIPVTMAYPRHPKCRAHS